MAALAMELNPNLRQLIDDRLESVEKHLLARGMPRSERLEVVAGLENQIFEMLAATGVEEPSRRDVLNVLGRLEPPEAYGGEARAKAETQAATPPSPSQNSRRGAAPCWVSITGLSVGASFLLLTCLAAAVQSETVAIVTLTLGGLASLVCGIVGIVRIRNSGGRLRGLAVAAVSTFLYPTLLLAYLILVFAVQSQGLTVAASFVGFAAVVAWMQVGLYRLVAIGYRRGAG